MQSYAIKVSQCMHYNSNYYALIVLCLLWSARSSKEIKQNVEPFINFRVDGKVLFTDFLYAMQKV